MFDIRIKSVFFFFACGSNSDYKISDFEYSALWFMKIPLTVILVSIAKENKDE